MRTLYVLILFLMIGLPWRVLANQNGVFTTEDIINDIYYQLTETQQITSEDVLTQLTQYAAQPLNINTITEQQLSELYFLSATQIDDILLYVFHHPLVSMEELNLINSLSESDIRALQVFTFVGPVQPDKKMHFREVFRYAKHEMTERLDLRNIETFESDPVYSHFQYKFNYHNRVQMGLALKRPPSGDASSLTWGMYLQLNEIGCFHTIVGGNYQAHFGQGLVLSNPFHMGKNNYVLNAGMAAEGLKKYTSTDGQGLHGAGATATFAIGDGNLDASLLYSWTQPNDTLNRHSLGTNITWRQQQWKIGITIAEHLYSDSVRYYRNMAYNRNYFRGNNQCIAGLNARYNWGKVDLFGEIAAAQNSQWGFATNIGTRITPISDFGLTLLYRYYSPYFDNILGYGLSESSRINDENGVYLAVEHKRLKNWIFTGYADFFYFEGIKYGIPYYPSWGYDAMADVTWSNTVHTTYIKLRARQKAKISTYSLRLQYTWKDGPWMLRTQADGNMVTDSVASLTWGAALSQDIHYCFATTPLTLQGRLQVFHATNWNNRIYCYENDVLYAMSNNAIYGQGIRMYMNLRWKIIEQLSLYLRISETLYSKAWAQQVSRPVSDTDIHLLLRATL